MHFIVRTVQNYRSRHSYCWGLYMEVYLRSQHGEVITTSGVNTLRPRQHGRHFADDTFKRIFLNENVIISVKISLKFVPNGPINNIPALVQIMAWRRPGDKPLSEAMMVSLLTHICVTRPQWVKYDAFSHLCHNCNDVKLIRQTNHVSYFVCVLWSTNWVTQL